MENKEKMLGVMLDCSRNAVMNVESVKNYASIIRKMGYNTLMLYTEDTYEVDNQPYFGHLRGRYTKEEMKELDKYCNGIGIELIPCIQTLAHLEAMFKWGKEYACVNDCDNILLAEEEKTYKLIEDMVSTLAQCFTTKKIHIGMDEAYRVGTGKYKELHGEKDRFDIINNHLHKVCEILDKYGFEPMIWSDMFCKLAMDTQNQYDVSASDKILEKASLPENVSLVYWDYYSVDYDHYVKNIETNKLFKRNVYFAGGAWTWKGLAPDNDVSIKSTEQAIKACQNNGIDGMFFTVWGDDGGECSKYAVLPSLMYAAEASRGNFDIKSIKEKFKEITNMDFDSVTLFDKLDIPEKQNKNDCPWGIALSKIFLYNDVFHGIRDALCEEENDEYYRLLANEIKNAKGKGELAHLFRFYEKLADVLSVKASLGIKTREAYKEKDIKKLKELIKDYERVIVKLNEFHEIFEECWFKENKPHGFEIQDIRLGGLIQRIKGCKNRLEKFANGDISEIPELEEPVLESFNGGHYWHRIVSANNI